MSSLYYRASETKLKRKTDDTEGKGHGKFVVLHLCFKKAVIIKMILHLSGPILYQIWLLIQPVILVGGKAEKVSLAKY
uniref:Uncharacterized protein MANES_02G144900 n=1 Tax=Rhizophora mucronata TaxID=61149 RepID=A0A2P2M4T2_RHIMU